MSSLGIQALLLPLASLHLMLTHHELMETIDLVRTLGNSYRLASLEPGGNFLYGRFAFNFCRSAAAWATR